MTIYEKKAFLYGYPDIEGKPATCYYLPTGRSLKWRRGWSTARYSSVAYNVAYHMVMCGEWDSFKFEEGM